MAIEQRDEVVILREALAEIAGFRSGGIVERQAYLMREKARIALVDSLTRGGIRSDKVDEITELWKDYCNGDLSLEALAQELGEALAAQRTEEPSDDQGLEPIETSPLTEREPDL